MAALFQPEARSREDDRARREASVLARISTAALAGLFIPPLLQVTGADLAWQISACSGLILPLTAIVLLTRLGNNLSAQLVALGGLFLVMSIVAAGARTAPNMAFGWLILAPLETAVIEVAPLSLIGGVFPIAILIGFAALEHLGVLANGSELRLAAALAPPAAVCVSILISGFRTRSELRRKAELVSSSRYQALSEAVGELVMHHDANGHVLSVSDEAVRPFDIDPAGLMGLGFYNRVHVGDRPGFLQAINSALRGDQTASATLRLRSGEVSRSEAGLDEPVFAWAEIRLRRLNPMSGTSPAKDKAIVVSVTRNISDAKEVERRLETARAEAELAVTLKDRLLANVSHELRTPLNAILGFSEILGDGELAPSEPAKRIEYARIIHSSAEHLLSVVNLVLDMSKIEAGKFEIMPEPFEVEPLIKDCCDMLRLKADAGNVSLIRSPVDGQREIVADKRACRQILLNLMSNAVKFTPPDGCVTIGADVVDSNIHFYVMDTGIGIASDDLPRLGSPFFQVKSNYDRTFEGAGLGLSLVRGLVGLHGGSLLLESAAGVGTRVTVRLPLDCRTAPRAGVGASRLETVASFNSSSTPTPPAADAPAKSRVHEERKIA